MIAVVVGSPHPWGQPTRSLWWQESQLEELHVANFPVCTQECHCELQVRGGREGKGIRTCVLECITAIADELLARRKARARLAALLLPRRIVAGPGVSCLVTATQSTSVPDLHGPRGQRDVTIGQDVPERGVEDRVVRVEELERVAVRGGVERHGFAPGVWERCAGRDVGRDILSGEEPHGYSAVNPLHCTRVSATA